MVEPFNGRISDILGQTRFKSIAELEDTMNKYAKVYNHHIPQKALQHAAPIDAMKKWQQSHPDLVKKKVYKQTGLDTYLYHLFRWQDTLKQCKIFSIFLTHLLPSILVFFSG
ncbi:MAG TPA: hypothetical protein EYP39_10810 [Ghiorsea sp.]|nr:hypothetical protein [Ghiorsea sp.]